jgi:hypothetical protein
MEFDVADDVAEPEMNFLLSRPRDVGGRYRIG